jgi:hypothetical protein
VGSFLKNPPRFLLEISLTNIYQNYCLAGLRLTLLVLNNQRTPDFIIIRRVWFASPAISQEIEINVVHAVVTQARKAGIIDSPLTLSGTNK